MGLVLRFFADILLTPLEATRIRLVSDRKYATGLVSGFTRLAREGGIRDMYAGFLPILCKCVVFRLYPAAKNGFADDIRYASAHPHRQIPYALGQFTVNEYCHELVYRQMSEERKAHLSRTENISISLGSGIIAGFAAAVLSQPADTLLSQVGAGRSHSCGDNP